MKLAYHLGIEVHRQRALYSLMVHYWMTGIAVAGCLPLLLKTEAIMFVTGCRGQVEMEETEN